MTTVTVIFGGLAAIGGLSGLASLVKALLERRKVAAEAGLAGVSADVMLSKEARELFLLARSDAQDAKVEAQTCRAELDALRDHVDHLERIMRDAGLTPPPFRWPLHQIGGPAS